MANRFFSGWPEDAACWTSCQAGVGENVPCVVPQVASSDQATSVYLNGYSSCYSPWPIRQDGMAEDKAASASKSHSEAEKRRRDRINAQLATLRKLIPMSEKMDKAALLGSAVEHVKDLKRKAKEISKVSTIPSDIDEVTIDYLEREEDASSTSKENTFIKVSLCCDDRPELFSEINHAFQGLKLTVVQADMTSLAGRIKSIFVLCAMESMEAERICMDALKQSLKVVLSRIVISSSTSNYRIKSKRQRFFLHSD